jgi:predicted ferric reductase
MYILERIFRLVRGSTPTIVKRVHALKGDVLFLELEKPTFVYKAGQYCFLNAPLISRQEWHPFTISSSPDQEFLTFHIRTGKLSIPFLKFKLEIGQKLSWILVFPF